MDEEKKELIEIKKVDDIEKTEETVTTNTKQNEETKVKEEPKKDRKGFCIAAMILGIIALVFFCVWYISIPCAILAIIFGVLGIKTTSKGMAIAGLVTGIIGLVIWAFIIMLICIFGFTVGFFDALDNDDYDYNYDYNSYRGHYDYDWYDYDL